MIFLILSIQVLIVFIVDFFLVLFDFCSFENYIEGEVDSNIEYHLVFFVFVDK